MDDPTIQQLPQGGESLPIDENDLQEEEAGNTPDEEEEEAEENQDEDV